MAAQIDKGKCTGCSSCTEVCPVEALAVNDGTAAADADSCVECGACVEVCPAQAISLP